MGSHTKNYEFKLPIVALLWSATMAGFGQFYNGQYIFGFLLLVCEFIANVQSNLNVSILHSFHLDHQRAHDIVDFQWGLFYPSIYVFSMWQAYNKAIIINCLQQNKETPRETYLTGFCFGMVIGMNLGIYWHHNPLEKINFLRFLRSPVMNGLLLGLVGSVIGHLLEKYIKQRFRN